ncbi:MAG TPA: choline/ethanolamine kinase family protein [Gaiellaceae bacterium]|nr:choline/ethanolamine kinase family protein [Gaiellaceae bacterium]
MPLEEVLAAVPELRDAESVERLTGGLTNTNYKVTSPSGCYVVRISGKDTSLLAIDRENEVHNTIAAAETGVGAPFVAALPEQDALVLGFLEGEVMDAEKLRTGGHIAAVAAACCRLHSGRRFLKDFDMFEIQPGYLEIVRERGFRLPARYEDFEPKIRELERAMRVRPEATVPCNNDLLAENFILVDGEMRLIDYEYSGNNEASFELGNVWSESNLSLGQLEELVAAYWGEPLRNKVARARLWGLMSKYGWTLWGSIQVGISDLDFDFWGWAMEKYERAVAELDGPEFEQLLADVQRED